MPELVERKTAKSMDNLFVNTSPMASNANIDRAPNS